jgi:hypothetical protein
VCVGVCVFVCVCVCVCVCMYVCMHVCMYVRMFVGMSVCMHACMHVGMHVINSNFSTPLKVMVVTCAVHLPTLQTIPIPKNIYPQGALFTTSRG